MFIRERLRHDMLMPASALFPRDADMRFHRVLEKYSAPTTPRIDARGSRREIDLEESEIVPFSQLRPTS